MNLLDPIYWLNPAKQSNTSPQLNAYVCPKEKAEERLCFRINFIGSTIAL